jgi:hypothetical protein
MVSRVAKPACRWIGVLLLAVAAAGWMDGPVVGRHGWIGADEAMSIGHAGLGLFLLLMSFGGESMCAFALYASAAISVSFAGYVLYAMGSYDNLRMFDSASMFRSGEYFHLALGLTMAVFGKMNTARKQLFRE